MANKINSVQDLEIYNLANKLTIDIYKITSGFPKEERFGIVDQLRRASSSIGANIAESFGRYHRKDKVNFLYHARGSLIECQHFCLLSYKLHFLKSDELEDLKKQIRNLGVKINNYISAIVKDYKSTELQ